MRNKIQFDLETVGTTAEDTISCIGLRKEWEVTEAEDTTIAEISVIYNLPTEYDLPEEDSHWDFLDIEEYINTQLTHTGVNYIDLADHDIDVTFCEHESAAIKEAMNQINAYCDSQTKSATLVGYNSSGFDIPLLRTRCLANNINWRLTGHNSLDIQYVLNKQFNTTARKADVDTLNKKPTRKFGEFIGADVNSNMLAKELTEAVEEHGYTKDEFIAFLEENDKDVPTTAQTSLDDVFDLMVGVDIPDPFDDSKVAIDAHKQGNIKDVALHNVVDIWQTYVLTQITEEYGVENISQHSL